MSQSDVTMSTVTIHNPAEPRHFMRIKPVNRRIRVLLGDEILAKTTHALRIMEVGKDFYDPVIYVPEGDIRAALRRIDHQTHCPLKGDASYFDLTDTGGNVRQEKIAWSYADAFDFAAELKGHIAFAPNLVTVEDAPLN